MNTHDKTYQATPPDVLEDHIMNPCIPKTEAEHWACREIERLRRRLEIDPRWPNYDGIATRDETIRMLESVITRLERQLGLTAMYQDWYGATRPAIDRG